MGRADDLVMEAERLTDWGRALKAAEGIEAAEAAEAAEATKAADLILGRVRLDLDQKTIYVDTHFEPFEFDGLRRTFSQVATPAPATPPKDTSFVHGHELEHEALRHPRKRSRRAPKDKETPSARFGSGGPAATESASQIDLQGDGRPRHPPETK